VRLGRYVEVESRKFRRLGRDLMEVGKRDEMEKKVKVVT
jgi:hypothetical protein